MSTSTRSLPVLLDCDPGIDDAFALAYVACRDDVETVGVVTTAGNVGQDDVLRNALGVTDLLGMGVPVARGHRPLGEHLGGAVRRPPGEAGDQRRRGGVEGEDEHDRSG